MKVEAYVLSSSVSSSAASASSTGCSATRTPAASCCSGHFLLGCVPGGYYLWWSRRMTPETGGRSGRHARGRRRASSAPSPAAASGRSCSASAPRSWPLALVFGAWTLAVGLFLAVAALVGVDLREPTRRPRLARSASSPGVAVRRAGPLGVGRLARRRLRARRRLCSDREAHHGRRTSTAISTRKMPKPMAKATAARARQGSRGAGRASSRGSGPPARGSRRGGPPRRT